MKTIFKLIWMLPLFFHGTIHANEESYAISAEYDSGPYLIYLCSKKYYACVDESGFLNCEKLNLWSIKVYRSPLDCRPIKKYQTISECVKAQVDFINLMAPTDEICRHPRM